MAFVLRHETYRKIITRNWICEYFMHTSVFKHINNLLRYLFICFLGPPFYFGVHLFFLYVFLFGILDAPFALGMGRCIIYLATE